MSKYNLTDIFEEMSTAEKERFDRLSKDDQDKLKKVMGIMAKEKSMKSVNTDADFEREQRMQMDMREEEMISKDRYDKLLDGAASRYEELENQFIKFIQDTYDKDFDMEDFKDFQGGMSDEASIEESNKALKEHFGRFMKDYQ